MKSNLSVIDQLGEIKAKIAMLEAEEKKLIDAVKANGPGAYEGDLFRATVSESERATLDLEAVRKKLSRQFILANTNYKKVTTVRVVARTGTNVVAA